MSIHSRSLLLGLDTQLTRLGYCLADIDTHQPTIWGCIRTDDNNGPWIEDQVRLAIYDINKLITAGGDELIFIVREHPFARLGDQALRHGEAIGYVLAAIHRIWGTHGAGVTNPITLTPTEWKRDTVGKGNATKAQVREWAESLVGRRVESQDACDAIGIAMAGCMRVTAGEAAA